MKKRNELLFWSPLMACAVAQLVAAAADYTAWRGIMPDQMRMFGLTSCIVLPFLVVWVLTGWLLALGFKFEPHARKGLLWSSIRAKILYFGMLIGLIGIFSLLGGMMTWRTDFPWGIISLFCLVTLPPTLAFTYEYHGCRKLLPDTSKGNIITYIVVAVALAAVIAILFVLVILLAVFLYVSLGSFAG